MKLHKAPSGGVTAAPERLSLFQRIADKVSYAMGTPANITLWIVAVAVWIAMGPYFAKHNFLPGWFTSDGFNFPLNTVTTIAELYIGFLVGASSNRSERNLEATLARIGGQETKLQETEDRLAAIDAENGSLLRQNTDLTQQVHQLTTEVHALLTGKGGI